jgi:acetyl-CoA synthetase
MPTCAEAIMLKLACLRIGAIHLVVFAEFGANALAERMRLAGVLKAVTLGVDAGDISTIEDEGSVEEARDAWREMKETIETQSGGAQ